MFNIIQTRKIWYAVSGIMFIASVVILIVWGIKPGIDFTGGTLLEVKFNATRPSETDIRAKIADLNLGDVQIQNSGEQNIIFKMRFLSNDERSGILKKMGEFGEIEEQSYEAIGPTIGQELTRKAIWAILIVVICIIIYVAYSFRGVSMGPVPSWAYGVGAIVALLHDIVIVIGIFAALGHFYRFEADSLFVTALLTILGYSVNDTIVVFDRIRENLRRSTADTFEAIINESINQTMTRSLNTGMCALFVLLALILFGGVSIQFFCLALFIGIIIGTYSSIFVASPFLLIYQQIANRKK